VARLPHSLPQPQIIDPASVPVLNWGVMGPGAIADVFVSSSQKHTRQKFVAVGSSSANRAADFAERHGIPRSYGSYEDLLADPDVDVIYVATRQHVHRQGVLAALAAGKHVLVEKPLATLPEDARAIRDAARASGKFVMEAMWTAYLPQSSIIRQLIEDGVLGEIQFIRADLGEEKPQDHWLFTFDGGGTTHDMGIYPLAFATNIIQQPPTKIQAVGMLNERGVDVEADIRLTYPSGARSHGFVSMLNNTTTNAWIDGTQASVLVDTPFPIPSTVKLLTRTFNPDVIAEWADTSDVQGHEGLSYQATAVAHFIGQGLTESPWRNLDLSVQDIETIATARHLIGAYYPGESGFEG